MILSDSLTEKCEQSPKKKESSRRKDWIWIHANHESEKQGNDDTALQYLEQCFSNIFFSSFVGQ
jgi:hypothetical protein